MPELSFVIKAFALSLILMVGLQFRVGNTTLEGQAHSWIQAATVPNYLKDVSAGAIIAIRNATKVGTDFIGKTFGHDSFTQKAGRLNLDFKRSPAVRDEQKSDSEK